MYVQDSDDEQNVEVNRASMQAGLRTIHRSPSHHDGMFESPVPSFAMAKPVDTGPSVESSQLRDEDIFGSPFSDEKDGKQDEVPNPAAAVIGRADSIADRPPDQGEESKEVEAEVAGKHPEQGEEQMAKRQKLLSDPKFAKGTRLDGLSPNSQKMLKEVRRLRAIENSNKWHSTFESKGVKKDEASGSGVAPDHKGEVPDPQGEVPGPQGEVPDPQGEVPDPRGGPAEDLVRQPPKTLNDMRVPWIPVRLLSVFFYCLLLAATATVFCCLFSRLALSGTS